MRVATAPLTLTVRSTQNKDGKLHFEGVANDANVTDSFGTRFNWTEDCLTRTGEVQMLWNHNPDAAIGRGTLHLEGGNLVVSAWVSDHAMTPYGVPVRALVEDGTVRGLSVHFDPEARYERGDAFDTITPNYLSEVSITTMPSNVQSNISATAVRSVLAELERHEDMGPLVGAIRSVLSETERAWSAPNLKDFTDKSWADLTATEKNHVKSFYLYAPADASKFGDLALPYKDPSTGKASLDALKAAASRLPNTDIPESAKQQIGKKIASEMKALGSEYGGEYAPRALDMRPEGTRAAGPLDFGTLTARLQDAVEDAWGSESGGVNGYGGSWCPEWVGWVYDEYCIVVNEGEAAYYRVPYSVDANGVVSLGVRQPVLMAWKDVQGNAEGEPEPPEPRGLNVGAFAASLRREPESVFRRALRRE